MCVSVCLLDFNYGYFLVTGFLKNKNKKKEKKAKKKKEKDDKDSESL